MRDTRRSGEVLCSTSARQSAGARWNASGNESSAGNRREQLGRDTLGAVVWPMSEVAAVLVDRSLRLCEPEAALEVGWLLAELEQRVGYGLHELARRFDRNVSWVSRRLALAEVLPEAIQQQIREGEIPVQVAMKFLVPVARQSLEDCQRMVAIFAQHRCDTRQAGQTVCRVVQGVVGGPQAHSGDPGLFFKTQRQAQETAPAGTGAELLRDLAAASGPTPKRISETQVGIRLFDISLAGILVSFCDGSEILSIANTSTGACRFGPPR